jgi:hypothetical protein
MTRRTTTWTTARTAAALAVLGAVALGSATACASGSAVNAGGSAAVSVSPSATPSVVVPVPTTPSAGTQTSIQPGGPILPAPSSSGPGSSGSGSSGSGTASAAPTGRGQTADGYSASGTVLTVHFYGGTCEKYGLHADQSVSGEVAVTVVVTQGPKAGQMCPAVMTPQTVSTNLGSPLDGRKVVDTTTGKTLPLADPMPSDRVVTHGPAKPN